MALPSREVNVRRLLVRQLRSPLLWLLSLTALLSIFVGGSSDAIIIGLILVGSILLGFFNEFRAARAAAALLSQIQHRCAVWRDGKLVDIDVNELVVGDVVDLRLGEIVPADMVLTSVHHLECDESMLTGESSPVPKSPSGDNALYMGTIVRTGTGRAEVKVLGSQTRMGRMAQQLEAPEMETEFQKGLRSFSMLLVQVAAVLTVGILAINIALDRPVLEAIMFSLAIAVGISPQLLPAVVSMSLAAGSHSMAKRKVLVKRLISIEDLGDVELLFTDKTGTLTQGRIEFMRALGPDGTHNSDPIIAGLMCSDSGAELDRALWESPASADYRDQANEAKLLDSLPFDHETRTSWALVEEDGKRIAIAKGAPESIFPLANPSSDLEAVLEQEFLDGNRVVAIASKEVDERTTLSDMGHRQFTIVGLLVFLDPPRPSAARAIERLNALQVEIKVITGDNATVAQTVCREIGLQLRGTLTGDLVDAMSDTELTTAIESTSIFARTSPEAKARIVRLQQEAGRGVAFLGDGVNDAIALHAADVGISVDSGTDVAKNAADVILLEKDLNVLADGIVEGRRVFANTIKYVLMGTSSNFGNMFSAAAASAFLPFLPLLPSQILLNNLLYDTSQLAIPTDTVDDDQLRKPSHWDIATIRKFMLFFGPMSSVFDFLTFALLLWGLNAKMAEFRAGWFVESLATQTLIIFVIRTRTTPFTKSRPSLPLTVAAISVVAIAAVLPLTPLTQLLGFAPLPLDFYAAILVMTAIYLFGVDQAKRWFFARVSPHRPASRVRTRD